MRSLLIAPALLLATFAFPKGGQLSERVRTLQQQGVRFQTVGLFEALPSTPARDELWQTELTKAQLLALDMGSVQRALSARPLHMAFQVPGPSGTMVLDLVRTEVTTDDFRLTTASGARADRPAGVHYRGMVRGVAGSWAAISLFDGQVMGLFGDAQGQWVLGPLEKGPAGVHVLYDDRDMRRSGAFTCGTREVPEGYRPSELEATSDRTMRCVRYYWEVNYNIYQDKGNLVNTTNYITGLFNQSATLFDNDGIDVTLSELFIWDQTSPYTGPGSGNFLDQFGTNRTTFNGDLAHLLGYGGGGGIAWLNSLCNGQTRFRMAYSGINSSYSAVPTYSWSTMVVTHEAGHNMGSNHTHACVWNGNSTAIDGCGPTASSSYVEGTCPTGPIPTPAVGGTIMSYCHLLSTGINLANGFGPQPAAVIVNRVNVSSCLSTCGTTCDAPGTLTAGSVTINSATLFWSGIGASSYTLRWRVVGAATWNNVTGLTNNSHPLSGLAQGTNHEFQVMSNCATGSSPWSGVGTFTTLVPCVDVYEPNNTMATATPLVAPAVVQALIGSSGDVDYYSFTVAAQATIQLSMVALADDYDMRLLSSTGVQLAISQAGGVSGENINYPNAAPGTYYVHAYGYGGAFNATACYSMHLVLLNTTCPAPTGLAASGVTHEEATIGWTAVSGAFAYDLRWRQQGLSTWNTIDLIVGTSRTLTGLAASTAYEVEVRGRCEGSQGGSSSTWVATSFTTTLLPCELTPNVRVAVKVFLDGPYLPTLVLMGDSLRTKGLIPLQEPYTAMNHILARPGLSTTAGVLAVTGNNAIVDWVVVELRTAAAPFGLVEARVALVQRDGDVVAVDGTSALGFCAVAGNYRVVVRHRNHLGVMSGSDLALSATATALDLTVPATTTYGTNARRTVGGVRTLWAGNTNSDGVVRYTGETNDRDPVLTVVGAGVPTATVTGYRNEDGNLDGAVRYIGANNDRDLILGTVGGSLPTNTVIQQLP